MTAPLTIPALTLRQPWGSAVIYPPAGAHKMFENRHWKPPKKLFGQRLAIHAGKFYEGDPDDNEAMDDPLGYALRAIQPHLRRISGCVLGTVRLAGFIEVRHVPHEEIHLTHWSGGWLVVDPTKHPGIEWWDREQYGWFLTDPKPFPEPIPACGHQGIWYWEVPEGVEV